jgi:hypothetical protein
VAWTETAPVDQEVAVELTIELWAGISEFLNLAEVLKALSSSVTEEVADEKRNGHLTQADLLSSTSSARM